METDTLEDTLEETQSVLLARKDGMSWRQLAIFVGVPHGILYFIGRGLWEHVSWNTVRKVRVHIGLPDPGEITEALPCPSCLRHGKTEVHNVPDCGGKIGEPVILSPGERVVQTRTTEKRRLRKSIHVSPEAHAAANECRQERGLEWEQLEAGIPAMFLENERLHGKVERLYALLTDDETILRIGRDCHDPRHDDRWCPTCEARLDGILEYRDAIRTALHKEEA